MAFENKIKSFGMTNMLIESEIDQLERKLSIELRTDSNKETSKNAIELAYFPQFAENLRREAAQMARSYELFYCLEKTIRKQIAELLESNRGIDWWNDTVIPQQIFLDVKKRISEFKFIAMQETSSVYLPAGYVWQ